MRDPSLHITQSELRNIIKNIRYTYRINELTDGQLTELLMSLGSKRSCNNRNVTVSNQMIERKVSSIVKAKKGDAMLLSNIIYNVRKKKHHKGITKITESNRDWPTLKQLTYVVIQFCNEFNLSRRSGFIEYISIGMSMISSTRSYLSKLINMQERINNEYECKIRIMEDDNSKVTKELHDLYIGLIVRHTNIHLDYYNTPSKYVYFVDARKEIERLGVEPEIYLKAQFEGLAWADSYPQPNQLVSDKSLERLNRYLFENKGLLKKSKKVNNDILLKIAKDERNKNRN